MISIHAPGWGATDRRAGMGRGHAYFNPRTRVGCDETGKMVDDKEIDFNPRTRVGCDSCRNLASLYSLKFQSTHPGGVRRRSGWYIYTLQQFQSTHPGGVRLYIPRSSGPRARFQSTHPGGVRQGIGISSVFFARDFNPRTRVGCDLVMQQEPAPPAPISIHAPGWGATLSERADILTFRISIHAPGWGATGSANAPNLRATHFNPRTRVGCDI